LAGGLVAAFAVTGPTPGADAAPVEPVVVVATAVGIVTEGEVADQAAADEADVEVRTVADTSVVTVETTDPEAVIAELSESGDYLGVALERYYRPLGFADPPNDPYYRNGTQWDLQNQQGDTAWTSSAQVGARFAAAWTQMATGAGAAEAAPIAIIDTGLPASPSAQLAGVVGKYDAADGDTNVHLPAGISALDAIHGGYVASVIAARANDGISITGAAWDNAVYFYKVLEDVNASRGHYVMLTSDIIVAMERAVADGAKVINMSFGSDCPAQSQWSSDPLAVAIQRAVAAGVTVVAAAGNSGNGTIECPASLPGVISVAASDRDGTEAYFSQRNAYVDITAPGEDIAAVSAYAASTTAEIKLVDGTSFSSPLVAAAAALIKRTYPKLTPALIERALLYTAQDAGPYRRDDYFGYGILDAGAALAAAANAATLTDPYTTMVGPVRQLAMSPDMAGGGTAELLVVDSTIATLNGRPGAVYYKLMGYRVSSAGALGTTVQIGANWLGYTLYAPGDWNGDGRADLMSRNSSGRLYLYPGNGSGGVQAASQIGSAWSPFTVVPTADLSGDGKRDILAIQNSTGDLYLYRGDGKGGFLSGRVKCGSGWRGWRLYAAGDITGDGRADIVGISPDGTLYQYPGNGRSGFSGRTRIGGGWNMYDMVVMGRFGSDSYVDIVAIDPADSGLYYYRGTGHGKFAARAKIGSGF
jgi:hypothetical protein